MGDCIAYHVAQKSTMVYSEDDVRASRSGALAMVMGLLAAMFAFFTGTGWLLFLCACVYEKS